MIESSKHRPDVKIQRLRFVAIGLSVLLVATIIGGGVIGYKTLDRLNAIQSYWLEFRQITANKGQSLSQIRNYFGFGGFIHDFQNYLSHQDPNLAGVVHRDIDELLAAVATYEVVGVSEAERSALADIRHVIALYDANLAKAERLIRAGAGADRISPLITVDDRPAFAALAALEVKWLEDLDAQTKLLMASVTESERLVKTAIVFVPVLALTVLVLLWFMRRLVQVTVETVRFDDELRRSEERNRLFAADVAHELRMPFAVMRLHLEKLDDRQTAESLLQDVEKISRMLEQLLAAAKMDGGAEHFADRVNLHEICVDVGTDMAPLAIREGRSIEVRGPDAPVLIKANRFALEQAVRNLVENAIKYAARETKVIIEVTDEPSVKVTDKGPGIPTEMREAIFDPFLRSDRRGGGAGLGLSIVRRAAEVHDATIEIGDTPGGGSIFTISFPREHHDAPS
ncbi:MAG: sensor histidine kinase [Rhodospirillales bacterium]